MNNPSPFTIEAAALYAAGLFASRTAEVAAGRAGIDFLTGSFRVRWSEVTAMFPEMQTVDARTGFQPRFEHYLRKLGMLSCLSEQVTAGGYILRNLPE